MSAKEKALNKAIAAAERAKDRGALNPLLDQAVARTRLELERIELLAEWRSPRMKRHVHRWERVQELRALSRDAFKAKFGKKQTVAAIWEIVAGEMRTTSAAIDQSCKRASRIDRRIKVINEELG